MEIITLPKHNKLAIDKLSACFNNTTNSYKFYWFLAILNIVKISQKTILSFNEIFGNMISTVWYPVNYFQLSFGKLDRLSEITLFIKNYLNLPENIDKFELLKKILNSSHIEITKEINKLAKYVPYRFLRPFFEKNLMGRLDKQLHILIIELSKKNFDNEYNPSLYRFIEFPEFGIEINEEWFIYLNQHNYILEGFTYWHLLQYLQNKNPNVPNIAGKLFQPKKRDLIKAKRYWNIVFNITKTINCIYSKESIGTENLSLDHFLPWRFVTHDLNWNIIPTTKKVNSAKGDFLPNMKLYFDDFAKLQYEGFQIISSIEKPKLLEDYSILFKENNIENIRALSYNDFKTKLFDTISPQIQIAQNMGFHSNWIYQK
ncbi:MAG: HNH endonuclease domain-containing protein [Candidatus Zhuqueibacterota bacterium]